MLKKTITILFNLFELVVLLVVVLLFLLRLGAFQDYIGKKIINSISAEWSDHLTVGSLSVNDFSSIHFFDLSFNEPNGDTAIYLSELHIEIDEINLFERVYGLNSVKLKGAIINLHKQKDETKYNLELLFNSKKPKENVSSSFLFTTNIIELEDCLFSHQNFNKNLDSQKFDYQHFKIYQLNGLFNNISITNEVVLFQDSKLKFDVNNQLLVNNFETKFLIDSTHLSFSNVTLNTLSSNFTTRKINYELNNKNDSTQLYIIDSITGQFHLNDVVKFYPIPFSIDTSINFTGAISGWTNGIAVNRFELNTGSSMPLTGNFKYLIHSKFNDSSLFELNIDDGLISANNLNSFLILDEHNQYKKFELPNNIRNLGYLNISLNSLGTLNNLKNTFSFQSNLGNIDGQLDVNANSMLYSGNIFATNLSGDLLNIDEGLNQFDANLKISGSGFNIEQLEMDVNGSVSNINYNEYSYQNMDISGKFTNQSFNGFFEINDPNISLSFNGLFDLKTDPVKYDFNIDLKDLNPYKLNWTNEYENTLFSCSSRCIGTGLSLDEFLGKISLSNILITQYAKPVDFKTIDIKVEDGVNSKLVSLQSDLLSATMEGKFKFNQIINDLSLISYLNAPNIKWNDTHINQSHNENYEINVVFQNFNLFSDLFIPDLSIAYNTSFKTNFNAADSSFQLSLNSNLIEFQDLLFSQVSITLQNESDESNLDLKGNIGNLSNSSFFNFDNIALEASIENNECESAFTYFSNDSINEGEIILSAHAYDVDSVVFNVKDVVLKNNNYGTWNWMGDSTIIYYDNKFLFKDIVLNNNQQKFTLNGTIGSSITDELLMSINELNLSNFNSLINQEKEEDPILISGVLNMEISLKSILKNIEFTGDLLVNQIQLNDYAIGDVSFNSIWERSDERFNIAGGLLNENRIEEISFESIYYYPYHEKSNRLVGSVYFNQFNTDFVNPFLPKPYLGNFTSDLNGEIILSGSLDRPLLNGLIKAVNTKIDLLEYNTSFLINGDIHVSPNQIELVDAKVTDKFENTGLLSGTYDHDNFTKYSLNLITQFSDPFLIMNNEFDDNPLYYGDAFITGFSTISYDSINDLSLNIHVKTEEKTILTIPLYGDEDVVLEDFITFETTNEITEQIDEDQSQQSDLDYSLNIDLEITDDAQIQVVFDEMVGDIMKSRGNGDLRFFIDETLDFNMFGNYVVSSGEYLFTLKDFINKKFNVKPGGTITWFGDPYNAKLDLNAFYPLKTSLYSIMPSMERDNWTHKSDVNVDIHLQNDLMNPDIDFDITLPKSEESAQNAVKNLIYNEEAKNQQVFSLLILNKFIPDNQNIISDNPSRINGATTSEVLSNQLGNMISSFTDEFEIGFNYSPGDSISDDELSIVMSTQQFNDRLLINTNLGMTSSNDLNKDPNSFIGDVNLEYKLSKDGNLRLHAFNQSNEYDLSNQDQTNYTQGIGAYYRQSFDTFSELFCEMSNVFRRKTKKCNTCDKPKDERNCN